VVAYDFLCLKNNQEKESVFQDFDVICIVGTANPEIENVSFLPLEDIISGHEEEELMYLLKPHVEEASIQKINNNLIKHFSLQSVLNHLTILNPNQLMEHLSDALELLQNLIGRRFSNATRISMYVHLSCLIERLVTQRPIDSYPNLETFNQQQEEFIQVVRQAFESIEKTYSITIPLAEIGYIYDMVKIKVQ
jgi:sigma-54 dependent transcriptional regulator, gfr operon transcriptional activator